MLCLVTLVVDLLQKKVIRASGVPRGDVYICDGVNFVVGYV